MNAKELADRVVALGVGHKVSDIHYALYNTNRIGIEMLPDQFINDGRVMLALLNRVQEVSRKHKYTLLWVSVVTEIRRISLDKQLCPAIIEACCEALEANNGQ